MKSENSDIEMELSDEFMEFGESERKILIAAVRTFAEKGFNGARIDEIAERAGVNKAMIYYYFKSKDYLYTIIAETLFKRVAVILGQNVARFGEESIEDAVRAFIDEYLDFVWTHRIFIKAMLWELASGGAVIQKIAGGYFREKVPDIADFWNRGIAQGRLRPLDPRHLFVSIIGMVLFYFYAEPVIGAVWGENPMTPEHIQERKKEITDLIIHGIMPKQG